MLWKDDVRLNLQLDKAGLGMNQAAFMEYFADPVNWSFQ